MTQAKDEHGVTAAMIGAFTQTVGAKLGEAAALARTATTLGEQSLADRAFMTLLDAEPLIHDASMLLNAVSVLRRHERRDPPFD